MKQQAMVQRTVSTIFVTTLHRTDRGGKTSLEGVDDTFSLIQLPRDAQLRHWAKPSWMR